MTDTTTISVSKEFRDWLKSKGMKGESYEDIIKRLLKPEALQELEGQQEAQGTDSEDRGNLF